MCQERKKEKRAEKAAGLMREMIARNINERRVEFRYPAVAKLLGGVPSNSKIEYIISLCLCQRRKLWVTQVIGIRVITKQQV